MDNKKRNTIITLIIVALLLLGSGIYLFLNYTADEFSFNVVEKKWINDNANNVIDINVYNDIPVYGFNGEGIIFNFLDYFTKNNNINFNKISYYSDTEMKDSDISFQMVNNNKKNDNDILLYRDHYVVLSLSSDDYFSLDDTLEVGVLKRDNSILNNYFESNIKLVEYDDISLMVNALKEGTIKYIVLSNLSHMDDILENGLNIIYHIEDIKKDYVLRVKDNTLASIIKKSYNEYLDTYFTRDYSTNYLSLYYKSTNTSDLLQKNFNAKTYTYGYVVNMPYENSVNDKFVGTILNYINLFEEKTGVEIKTIRYHDIDALKSALVSGEVDFALGNFNYDNLNLDYVTTRPVDSLEYVILSKKEMHVNTIKGLVGERVSVVGGSLLYHELEHAGIKAITYEDTDELIRSMDDNSTVILDKETYIYYKDSKLKDYKVVVEDNIREGYRFILNKKNDPYNSIFSYFVSSLDYNLIKYDYNTNITLDKDYTAIKIFAFLVGLIIFLITTIILINKKNVTQPVITKDEKQKYIDPMTSLKNRNYLNLNIYKWDDNVIFPQSVVVMDVNRLREINDTYGREAGDEIIKKVASVLINNQLENTDIVRSGGDEFLIYMVGYEEKKVSEYAKKLLKDMKDIPDSYGVEIGYSMILDEVKTVDDAINEAIGMMEKNKEKKRNKE